VSSNGNSFPTLALTLSVIEVASLKPPRDFDDARASEMPVAATATRTIDAIPTFLFMACSSCGVPSDCRG
jgi:hypothetical protein